MFKGKGVSVGIGFGTAVVLKEQERKIEKTTVDEPEKEMIRFKDALKQVEEDTQQIVDSATGTEKEIMSAYLMIIQDPTLTVETENAISNLKYNAEYAVDIGFNSVIQLFESMDDEYMAGRARDIADIKNRVLAKLANEETINISKLPENTIIVATELTTSDTAKLDFKNVSGIISEIGGTNSHTSIMARTHAIPAITRVEDATKIFRNGDKIAINGSTGEIYLNPTQEETEQLQKLQKQLKEETEELEKYKKLDTRTKDDYKVELVANIGTPADIESVIKNSAEGVGLFRSEFLYMDNENMPTEEEQFEAYKKVAEAMGDKPVIIRTLDVGGDKEIKYLHLEKEANPFLGYRAIRLCLDNIAIFKIQLRAILRASAFGNLSIMFPMISSIEELREAKKILEECKKELDGENINYNKNIKTGIMIEIPSAALISVGLATECDFFSIGTNDLIQYTVAVERGNEKISKLYTKYHPAVIKLVKLAIDGAHSANIFCGMCGEAASDELYVPLLVGLGLDEFSMNPNSILKTRKRIGELDRKECEKLANEILIMTSAEEVEKRLKEFADK
mgnify:CR=1 FL=1